MDVVPPKGAVVSGESAGGRTRPSSSIGVAHDTDGDEDELLGSAEHVSVVIAVRNEASTIGTLLASLDRQTYPKMDVIVADGGSDDTTRQQVVESACASRVQIRLIDNPDCVTAAGLNRATAASDADIVIILGGHAEVSDDFVARTVEALATSGGDVAGGWLDTVGRTRRGAAIAIAMSSRLGAGSARFRTGGQAQFVDTVAFGGYRRAVLVESGGFDVSLVGAEDDELNYRLLLAGRKIWFDPAIRVRYFSRDSYRALAGQYFGYGRGKARVLRKHRRLPTFRALAPPLLVLFLASVLGAAATTRRLRPFGLAAPYVGLIAVVAGSRSGLRPSTRAALSAALATMHLAYGSGFWMELVSASKPARTFR